MTTILERLAPWRTRVDAALTLSLPLRDLDGTASPKRLLDAMAHGVLGGGKRLRPLLVLATARSLGADFGDDDALLARAMPSALAVELVHSYSLIHDDLPALDDDLARELGDFDSLDALTQTVRGDLGAQLQRETDAEARAALRAYYAAGDTRPLLARIGLLRVAARHAELDRRRAKAHRKEASRGPVPDARVTQR